MADIDPRFKQRPWRHRPVLRELLSEFEGPKTMVEVGVGAGRTSEFLLREFGDLTLFMIDPWGGEDKEKTYEGARDRVEFAGNRATIIREKSPEAARHFDGILSDLIFIDGDHRSKAVRYDLAVWWWKVKPKGIFCGHDIDNPKYEVRSVLDEFAAFVSRDYEVRPECGMWIMKR